MRGFDEANMKGVRRQKLLSERCGGKWWYSIVIL